MIIDLDSQLREGYFYDEVYNLPEPYSRFTPQKAGEGNHNTKFIHSLDPGDPQGRTRTATPISTIHPTARLFKSLIICLCVHADRPQPGANVHPYPQIEFELT
jgi:hypothetical protein